MPPPPEDENIHAPKYAAFKKPFTYVLMGIMILCSIALPGLI